jgi:hypothetical protein
MTGQPHELTTALKSDLPSFFRRYESAKEIDAIVGSA